MEDTYGRHLENQRKLAAWKEQKKAQQEAERVAALRARREAYVDRRAKAHIEITGSTPTPDDRERWGREFADSEHARIEAERAAKVREAIEEQDHLIRFGG